MKENKEIFAVLFDTVSIQNYVFSSNKLKENVGASYLVEEIFGKYLKDVLLKIDIQFNESDLNFCKSQNKFDELKIKNDSVEFEVGFIGGGNALLFFNSKSKAISFIQTWSKLLLLHAPGLKTSATIEATNIFEIENNYQTFYKRLFESLEKRKQSEGFQVTFPQHGITTPCNLTDFSSESILETKDSNNKKSYEYISSVAFTKLTNVENANNKLQSIFIPNHLKDYQFTNNSENFGQDKGKDNYIAIVHIDGNDMGKSFKEKGTSIGKIREIACKILDISQGKFKKLIEEIISLDKKYDLQLSIEDGKQNLPIRPVIFGGDDITYFCEGKLGIWSAYTLLKNLSQETIVDDLKFSACAGVAITNTKFPLYRGYKLAEEACRNAKIERSQSNFKGSWIDFHIHYKGITGSLEEIRKLHFQSPQGNLCKYRPYTIGSKEKDKSFENAICNANIMKKWPSGVIHKLREVLTQDEVASNKFIQENELKERSLNSFKIERPFNERLFDFPAEPEKSTTPYFDLIELTEFYPKFLLEEENSNGVKK